MPDMVAMAYTVTVHDQTDWPHLLERLAAAMADHGVEHVLVDWVALGAPGWRDVVDSGALRVTGVAKTVHRSTTR
jgi:hypothetical protein